MNIITFRKNFAEYKNDWELREEQNHAYKKINNIVIPRKTEKNQRNQFDFLTDFLKSIYSFAHENELSENDILIQNYGEWVIDASIDELKNKKTEDASKILETEVIKNIYSQKEKTTLNVKKAHVALANLNVKEIIVPIKAYASLIVSSNVKDLRVSIHQLYDSENKEQLAYAIKRNEINTGIKKLDSLLRGVCVKPVLQSPVFYAKIASNGSMNVFDNPTCGDTLDNDNSFRNLGLKVYQTDQFKLDNNI